MERKRYLGFLAMFFGSYIILGVFMSWTAADFELLLPPLSGWDIFNGSEYDHRLFPLFILMLGAVCVVIGVLRLMNIIGKTSRMNWFLSSLLMITGILVIILTYMAYKSIPDAKMGIGLLWEIGGGIGMTIIGILWIPSISLGDKEQHGDL